MRLMGQARLGFYPVPPEAIDAILAHLGMLEEGSDRVHLLDPCAGEGCDVRQLAEGLSIPQPNV